MRGIPLLIPSVPGDFQGFSVISHNIPHLPRTALYNPYNLINLENIFLNSTGYFRTPPDIFHLKIVSAIFFKFREYSLDGGDALDLSEVYRRVSNSISLFHAPFLISLGQHYTLTTTVPILKLFLKFRRLFPYCTSIFMF